MEKQLETLPFIQLPDSSLPRIVIVGAGFGGFTLAKKIDTKKYQVVLIDRNNFHQFQPLFYQVAMAGLEPSSISFPLRKAFQDREGVKIRVAECTAIDAEKNLLITSIGKISYDHLVLSMGATTNFFGNENIERSSLPLKSVSEALYLRNLIFTEFEEALQETDFEERQKLIDIVIVGGGPTGVELAGALAEMRKYILPKDYPELNVGEVDIHLVQGGPALLKGMSENASGKAQKYLEDLGVNLIFNDYVVDCREDAAILKSGNTIPANKIIWAAGITCHKLDGLDDRLYARGNRINIDDHLKAQNYENIYAIGDQAYRESEAYPYGHPQVAQVAIQMGAYLAKGLNKGFNKPFAYKDLGSLATIGRNKAVADLPRVKFQGFLAWVLWLIVHIRSLIGVKNKLIVFLNWIWNYITYDQNLRLIIKPKVKRP